MEKSTPAEQKRDRRIQRTEQLLHEALIELILEKGYDAITIQDILDRANIGRSTFYAHYRDKEDLLLSGFQVLFEVFKKEYGKTNAPDTDPVQAWKDFSRFFFQHAGSHRDLFKAMIGEQGGKVIQDHLLSSVTHYIRDHLAALLSGNQKDIPIDLLTHFMASSYLSLLSWWLDRGMPYPADQMDHLYQNLVFPGIQNMLRSTQPVHQG
jgi:AcrR family transcriptional regulator